jgi:hypothetical protein
VTKKIAVLTFDAPLSCSKCLLMASREGNQGIYYYCAGSSQPGNHVIYEWVNNPHKAITGTPPNCPLTIMGDDPPTPFDPILQINPMENDK